MRRNVGAGRRRYSPSSGSGARDGARSRWARRLDPPIPRTSQRAFASLSGTDDAEAVEQAFGEGVRSIISKNAPWPSCSTPSEHWFAAPTPPRLEARLASEENEARAWASLTPRERDVAGLVASGLPYKKVAEQLSISDHTVKNHLRRIYDKLDINSRVELALHAAADRP
ncbi:MAG: response regulator transcription factor [Bryobacterales bacterium]